MKVEEFFIFLYIKRKKRKNLAYVHSQESCSSHVVEQMLKNSGLLNYCLFAYRKVKVLL